MGPTFYPQPWVHQDVLVALLLLNVIHVSLATKQQSDDTIAVNKCAVNSWLVIILMVL